MECTLDVLKTILMNHYEPAPCEIVENYRFNTCDIQQNQKMTSNMALLRRRSIHYNYNVQRQHNPNTIIVRRKINTEKISRNSCSTGTNRI